MTENTQNIKAQAPMELTLREEPRQGFKSRLKTVGGKTRRGAKIIASSFWINSLRFIGEVVSIALGLAFFWFLAINYVLAKDEVDISFLGRNAEIWFSEVFEGHDATLDTLTLDWKAADNAFLLKAGSLSVKDKNNVEIENLGAFEAEISVRAALTGQLEARRIKIDGGLLTLLRKKNGDLLMGLGAPDHLGSFGPVIEAKNRNRRVPATLPQITLPKDLKRFDLSSGTVFIVDQKDGLNLTLNDAEVLYEKTTLGPRARIAANIQSVPIEGLTIAKAERLSPAPIEIRLSADAAIESAEISLKINGFNPSQFAAPRGIFASLADIEAPVDFQTQGRLTRARGLETADAELSVGTGTVAIDGESQTLNRFVLSANFDRASNRVSLTNLDFESGDYRAKGDISIGEIFKGDTAVLSENLPLKISLNSIRADLRPSFQKPITVAALTGDVLWDRNLRTVKAKDIVLNFGDYVLEGAISAGLNTDGKFNGLSGTLSTKGRLSQAELLALWPVKFADGARRWIARSVNRATLSNIDINVDFEEKHFKGTPLTEENLALTFDISDADITYISTMTPYLGASGTGWLRGNQAEIQSVGGRVGEIDVLSGRVGFPQLFQRGGSIEIEIDAAGEASNLLSLIDEPPFKFPSRFGVNPAEFTGTGTTKITISRPLLADFDPALIRYSAQGDFRSVTAPYGLGKHKITEGDITFKVDKSSMEVSGPVKLGPWQTDLTFKETFDAGRTPTQVTLLGPMTQKELDGFGLGLRAYFGGQMDVRVEAQGAGVALSQANVSADLRDADINLFDIWTKPVGQPANMTVTVRRDESGAANFDDFEMTAPGLRVGGSLGLTSEYQLKTLSLPTLEIDGFVSGELRAKPNTDRDALDVRINGKSLNVTPFVKDIFSGGSSDFKIPVEVTTSVDRLVLSENYSLTEATLSFLNKGKGVERASVTGLARGAPFSASLWPNPDDMGRLAKIDIPNASEAAFAFFNLNNTTGGTMKITADLPEAGETGMVRGTVTIENFILVKAPALAQMLSLASLKGLADVMGGTGLTFDSLSVPFGWDNGNLSVRDARAAGPALGLTGNGEINFNADTLDLDGVLVPAYSANSVLGEIPILGDIFVGKKGEGIFALNYAIKGTMDQSQVAVNPLSALTPGFLRRIFDTQRQSLPEDTQRAIESVRPPNPRQTKEKEDP